MTPGTAKRLRSDGCCPNLTHDSENYHTQNITLSSLPAAGPNGMRDRQLGERRANYQLCSGGHRLWPSFHSFTLIPGSFRIIFPRVLQSKYSTGTHVSQLMLHSHRNQAQIVLQNMPATENTLMRHL